MTEINSKRMYVHNLPENRVVETKINSKPTVGLLVFAFFGLILLFADKVWIFGLIVMAFSLAGVVLIKNHVMTELNGEYAVFYKEGKPDECFFLYWSDVDEWQIMPMKTGLDRLVITLKDGEKVVFPVFSRAKIEKYFKKYAPNRPKVDLDDDDE